MKTGLFIAVMALALVWGSGYVDSGTAMMGGRGHGGGGMGGHGGGAGWGGRGSGGGWSGSDMGPGSMARQGGTMPNAQSGSGHQGMSPDSDEGSYGDGQGHGTSDMQETVDGQRPHGDEDAVMSPDQGH